MNTQTWLSSGPQEVTRQLQFQAKEGHFAKIGHPNDAYISNSQNLGKVANEAKCYRNYPNTQQYPFIVTSVTGPVATASTQSKLSNVKPLKPSTLCALWWAGKEEADAQNNNAHSIKH